MSGGKAKTDWTEDKGVGLFPVPLTFAYVVLWTEAVNFSLDIPLTWPEQGKKEPAKKRQKHSSVLWAKPITRTR